MLEREYVLPLPRATAVMLQQFVDEIAARRYQDDAYSVYELPRRERGGRAAAGFERRSARSAPSDTASAGASPKWQRIS